MQKQVHEQIYNLLHDVHVHVVLVRGIHSLQLYNQRLAGSRITIYDCVYEYVILILIRQTHSAQGPGGRPVLANSLGVEGA